MSTFYQPENVHRFSRAGPLSTVQGPSLKVRSSGVRDYLVANMAKESKHQRALDQERWQFLQGRNAQTRGAWLEQLEQQINDTRNRLEIRSSSLLTHPSGRPHTGFRITSARRNPSALVQPVRTNGKFQLDSRQVAPSREAATRLFDMCHDEKSRLYHVAPDTIGYARGRTPEITASLAQPINQHEYKAMLKTRDYQQSQRETIRRNDNNLAKTIRSSRVDEAAVVAVAGTGGSDGPDRSIHGTSNSGSGSESDVGSRDGYVASDISGNGDQRRVRPARVRGSFAVLEETEATRLLQETLRLRASPPPPRVEAEETLKEEKEKEKEETIVITADLERKSAEDHQKMDTKQEADSLAVVPESVQSPDPMLALAFADVASNDEPLGAQLDNAKTGVDLPPPALKKSMKVKAMKAGTGESLSPPTSPRQAATSRAFVASPSSPSSPSPSKRVRFAFNPVAQVSVIPAPTPKADKVYDERTRMSARNSIAETKGDEYKRETVKLATEVLVHSMRGTPKSILMLERLGAKLLQQNPLGNNDTADEGGMDMGMFLKGNEAELGPVLEKEGRREEDEETGKMEIVLEDVEAVEHEDEGDSLIDVDAFIKELRSKSG